MSTARRKICVVTGTRAEYGLLRWVMQGIQGSELLDLQLIVTGMHLSPDFGLTVQEIEADGFRIDRKVEMLLSSDTPIGITKSMGLAMIGFADALADLQPDLLLVLGDRFETFAAASAALIACVPIAHCHGGELTEGAFDDALRHSITKMAHLHFVALQEYRQRVIQLGEEPSRVFTVGALGLDSIRKLKLLSREELEEALGFNLFPRNLLITFHPPTLEKGDVSIQIDELLQALSDLQNIGIVFTMPNADTESRSIFNKVNNFCMSRSNARAYTSLGQLVYFSCIKHFDGVVGNSSSGLIEAPSFQTGTINIGNRQRGRLKGKSVIDCLPRRQEIENAITSLFSRQFQELLHSAKNPYEKGCATNLILEALEGIDYSSLIHKSFYDVT